MSDRHSESRNRSEVPRVDVPSEFLAARGERQQPPLPSVVFPLILDPFRLPNLTIV